MANRERKHQVIVYLSDDEMRLLEQRCELNKMNKSQVIRDLIIFGFNYYVDYGNLNKTIEELNAIGKNINQIAAKANKTNSIYKSDIETLQKDMKEIWQSLISMLSTRRFRKQ